LYIFNATVFPILHDDHWSVFVVAILDGYFVFLDSFFEEDHQYQKDVRDLVVNTKFLKAWDESIGIDWNFDEFVIHHAAVPKQDTKFFQKYDDGVFAMKFLELWDPRMNLMQKFSSGNIADIRVIYINDMIFSPHNSNKKGMDTISNHQAMV
uniref:Ubiquitin-like protease family profile domain-containing protein n=1 Tax=Setaria italica TaxID=4555 RepID=A0A0Q3VRA7_SETIT